MGRVHFPFAKEAIYKAGKILPVILILVAALFLRTWNLEKPDVSPDEYHYISDAHRFLTHDPYMSLRHHPFAHAQPNIGHPFLVQIITVMAFKVLGVSIFTSRLPSALAGVATIAALFLFGRGIKRKMIFYAASILAILPFMVRYNRDAHLDSIFTLWMTLIPVAIFRYHQGKNKVWLIFAGLICGFAFSTKLDGIFALVLAFGLLLFTDKKISLTRKFLINFWHESVLIFMPFALVVFLLNDPGAYLDGVLHPSDRHFNFLSGDYLTRIGVLPTLIPKVAGYLISAPLAIVYLVSLAVVLARRDMVARFLLLWQVLMLGTVLVHLPGMSGDWGWMPIIVSVILTVGYVLSRFSKKKSLTIFALLIISLVPNLYMYGLRFKPLPYLPSGPFNRTINDTYYQTVVSFVNKISPPKGHVYFLPPYGYTVYILRDDLSWSYFGDLAKYNVFVVEDQQSVESVKDKIKLAGVVSRFQDGRQYTAYIYLRTVN